VERVEGLTRDRLDAALREADLYVQPSHEEGFCLAFIEAAAVVPRLVGTDAGAIAAIAEHDADMRVVPPRAPRRLAEASLSLLARRPAADAMGARSRRLQDRFAWSRYLESHLQLYERAMALHAARQTVG
jgi:glycosyltransferase involved in cell wall biosynthesis